MNLLHQIKQRRHELGLQQKDMQLRIGMNRQQYQRIEAGGNPRLDTLELIAEGLNSELMLIPIDKLQHVKTLLRGETTISNSPKEKRDISEDPWIGVLK